LVVVVLLLLLLLLGCSLPRLPLLLLNCRRWCFWLPRLAAVLTAVAAVTAIASKPVHQSWVSLASTSLLVILGAGTLDLLSGYWHECQADPVR
jgi:hypothetical protein